jgi:hypothetical protein
MHSWLGMRKTTFRLERTLTRRLKLKPILCELRLSRNKFGASCNELIRTLTRATVRILRQVLNSFFLFRFHFSFPSSFSFWIPLLINSLSWNELGVDHVQVIDDLMLQNQYLMKLSLMCNRFLEADIDHLARTASIRPFQFVVKLNHQLK